ncbi:MAG: hydantoinase/oxoprolinase family protein, partial [Planctomycetota bacterium]
MRPTANDVFVCADVGGTFTDCMVGWNDSQGNAYCRRMKVLSSGLLRCRLAGCRRVEETADLLVRLELPAELFTDQEASTDGASLADDFFRSAGMSLVVDGTSIPMGVIDSWDTSSGEMAVKPQDGAAFDSPPQGALIEIDCRLEAPVLATRLILGIPIGQALPRLSVRLGTTRGTNALLTRSGAPTALVINHGFGDALLIGEQDRPDLFDLAVYKEPPLAEHLMEIRGRIDATGTETEPLVEPEIEMALETLRSCGVESIAICLLNAYLNPLHEQAVEKLARQAGFTCVSRSSEVAPLIKLVARAETTSLDAYLSPVLTEYVNTVRKQFGGAECDLTLMTSSGNLVPDDQFRGRDSVLSGPAGGVVGLQTVAMHAGCPLAIGLDMGGTSTDVTRFDGQVGRRYESRLSGLRIMTPMMDIHTVAAGGGSICDFQGGRLVVGPESAGAAPGPACYGSGGPLTVTDINLLLGRVLSSRFPFPLDRAAAEERLEFVAGRMAEPPETRVALAEGFLEIAITHMAEAVRAITTARGVDVRDHALVGFGGAAAQHVCRVAEALGIRQIIDHPQGSILSAVGIGAARLGNVKTVGIYRTLQDVSSSDVEQEFRRLLDSLGHVPSDQDVDPSSSRNDQWDVRYELDLRYVGTDESLAIEVPIESTRSFCGTDLDACADRFHEAHQGRFGYQRIEQPIELVSLRCEVQEPDTSRRAREVWLFGQSASRIRESSERSETTQVFERGGWQSYDV